MSSLERTFTFYSLPIVLLLMVALLLTPLLLRIGEGAQVTPGAESYVFLRQANLMLEGSWAFDPIEQIPIAPSPYTALLAGFVLLGVPWILPLLLAVLLLILIDRVLITILGLRALLARLALVFFAISPAMSALGTSHTPITLALCLLAGAILLLERYPFFTFLCLLAGVITSPIIGVCGALALLIWQAAQRKTMPVIYASISLAVGFAWMAFWSLPSFMLGQGSGLIFEFGVSTGASAFFIIFALFGIADMAPRKRIFASLLILGSGLLAWYFTHLLILFSLVLCVFGAQAVLSLITARWELDLLRQLVIILLFCVVLFLIIVAMRERINEEPDAQFSRTIIYLTNQHRPGAVLTDPAYAHLIEYFTQRQVTPVGADREEEFTRIVHSRNAGEVYDFLEDSQTSFVLVTDEMRDRHFTHSDEGILFLLPNALRFVLIHEQESSGLWYYISR